MSFNSHNTRGRTGLTLIEVIISGVLAALLMLTIVQLMRSLESERRVAADLLEQQPDTTLLSEQIRRDLAHAQFVRFEPGRLTLQGWLSSPSDRQARWLSRQVIYQISSTQAGQVLLRRETPLQRSSERSQTRVLWIGAATIRFRNLGLQEEDPNELEESERTKIPTGMSRLGTSVQLSLHSPSGRLICQANVAHHLEYEN